MESSYDVDVCNVLKGKFQEQKLYRPMRVEHYDPGTRLVYDVTGVETADHARVHMEIEKFVGGGFAGQVYRIRILEIESPGDTVKGLEPGGVYAMKILIPPSGFSKFFRNLLYRIGFQGPFQLQVNPTASRSGALWQKFIRRGAQLRFGAEAAVNDIHATFVDSTLGSCGEISDWVDGRTWRLEVDDRLDLLKRFYKRKYRDKIDPNTLGSPEYRAKKRFMKEFVKLLQEMGAHEFARQYEWSTCKSQPNCLKRKGTDSNPSGDLIAVDFRAGLALLPFLPMSPGDVKLIFKGLGRGSLVQFDRGNLKRLEAFIDAHGEAFADMRPVLEELKADESVYRSSVPDITHNFFRLFYSRKLWSTMLKSTRTGWKVQNITGGKAEKVLEKSIILTFLFYFLGVIPFLGSLIRKLWARADWRKHYFNLFRWSYLKRALRGKCAEKAITWHRDGRLDKAKALKLADSFVRYSLRLPLSILPVGLYRFLTEWSYFKDRLYFLFVRPIRLYFSASMREQWLQDMVAQGQEKHILGDEDAGVIRSQLKEPFIQKYLKSLAVHVCTLPVTQIVSVAISWIYVRMHPELSAAEATAAVAAILILFQITPISPGSLVRGLYVVYLVIKDRNFKDYNIAVFLGFFKYIGYLAFPIQMTYRYPELARFMAVHWATDAVHIIPVFGERGALLEHWVFRLFYSWPLTIRRRMRIRAEMRATMKSRYWHIFLYAAGAAALLGTADMLFLKHTGIIPVLKNTWWFAAVLIIIGAVGVTLGNGGAALSKRIISASFFGILAAVLYTALTAFWVMGGDFVVGDIIVRAAWRLFIFTVLSAVAAVVTELRLPDPTFSKI
jgi:hypothetical protein